MGDKFVIFWISAFKLLVVDYLKYSFIEYLTHGRGNQYEGKGLSGTFNEGRQGAEEVFEIAQKLEIHYT
jgi:hypothetical protein